MFYVYKIEWSQTEEEYIIFFCDNGKPSEYLNKHYKNARYKHYICVVDNIGAYINMHSKING